MDDEQCSRGLDDHRKWLEYACRLKAVLPCGIQVRHMYPVACGGVA